MMKTMKNGVLFSGRGEGNAPGQAHGDSSRWLERMGWGASKRGRSGSDVDGGVAGWRDAWMGEGGRGRDGERERERGSVTGVRMIGERNGYLDI
jgi:hypothetical protein